MDATRFDRLVKSASESSSRRRALKVLGGGLATGLAAVVGLRPRGADAMPISQNGFVNHCRENDGVSRRISTRTVRCTYPCAYYTQCNFLYSPPSCHEVLLTC